MYMQLCQNCVIFGRAPSISYTDSPAKQNTGIQFSAADQLTILVIMSSGNKKYTFETSRQMLTSIDTTRLAPYCSLPLVYC